MKTRFGWMVALPLFLGAAAFSTRQSPSDSHAVATPTADWPAPPILPNTSQKPGVVELTLTAAPTRLELVPGKPTEAWAYNGSVPGPTIELREGDLVTVHFRNKLAQATTVHWHGLHLPSTHDG